jgi:hypothetical protein
MAREVPRHREAVVTACTRLPSEPLHIAPPRELLAYAVRRASESSEVMQP